MRSQPIGKNAVFLFQGGGSGIFKRTSPESLASSALSPAIREASEFPFWNLSEEGESAVRVLSFTKCEWVFSEVVVVVCPLFWATQKQPLGQTTQLFMQERNKVQSQSSGYLRSLVIEEDDAGLSQAERNEQNHEENQESIHICCTEKHV